MPWEVARALRLPWLRCTGCGEVAHQIRWGYFPDGKLICPGCRGSKGVEVEMQGWIRRSPVTWNKCLSGGTWLYAKTQKGVMPQMVKDLVRLDPATVQLWNGSKWTQVVSWEQVNRLERPIEIELRSGENIGCLPTHRWPTQRGLVWASELKVGDVIDSTPLPDEGWRPPWLSSDALWFAGLYLACLLYTSPSPRDS